MDRIDTTFYTLPRIVGVLSIVFISAFALDAFESRTPLALELLGMAVHLIPSAVLLGLLILAWRYERIGGLLFVAVSFLPFLFLNNAPWVNALIGAPFLITGILFLVDSYVRRLPKREDAPQTKGSDNPGQRQYLHEVEEEGVPIPDKYKNEAEKPTSLPGKTRGRESEGYRPYHEQ